MISTLWTVILCHLLPPLLVGRLGPSLALVVPLVPLVELLALFLLGLVPDPPTPLDMSVTELDMSAPTRLEVRPIRLDVRPIDLEDPPMALSASLTTPVAVGNGPPDGPGVHRLLLTMAVQCRNIPGCIIPTSGASALRLRSNLLLSIVNPCMDLVWEIPVPVRLTHRRTKVCIVLPLSVLVSATLVPRFRFLS